MIEDITGAGGGSSAGKSVGRGRGGKTSAAKRGGKKVAAKRAPKRAGSRTPSAAPEGARVRLNGSTYRRVGGQWTPVGRRDVRLDAAMKRRITAQYRKNSNTPSPRNSNL